MNLSECYITAITPYGSQNEQSHEIEEYIVTSSAEIGIVDTPRAQQVISDCAPKGYTAEIPLVSIGCAGLFAAVMKFAAGPARTARILALETPSDFVQSTLDCAQLGAGGDGFVAQDVAYVLDLQKFPEGALARIEHCEIMSRPSCFAGTSKLARNFLARLEELDSICPDARIVTFENVSGYARRLMQAVKADVSFPEQRQFLETVEQDERHFMTVRPLAGSAKTDGRRFTAPADCDLPWGGGTDRNVRGDSDGCVHGRAFRHADVAHAADRRAFHRSAGSANPAPRPANGTLVHEPGLFWP